MGSRASFRLPIKLKVTLSSGEKVCSGTVKNLSESSMFIITDEVVFDEGSQFDISIRLKDETFNFPGKLVRLSKVSDKKNGIGVQLLNPPQSYLDFVENLLFFL